MADELTKYWVYGSDAQKEQELVCSPATAYYLAAEVDAVLGELEANKAVAVALQRDLAAVRGELEAAKAQLEKEINHPDGVLARTQQLRIEELQLLRKTEYELEKVREERDNAWHDLGEMQHAWDCTLKSGIADAIQPIKAERDRAQAACAELSFALGVAYAATKENGVTLTEDCEQTIINAMNNELGQHLCDLVKACIGHEKEIEQWKKSGNQS